MTSTTAMQGVTKDMKRMILGVLLIALCGGCSPKSCLLEPKLSYTPQARRFDCLESPFKPLSPAEKKQDWGKELTIGLAFAKEMDLYRAITGFKRAFFLIPRDKEARRLQIAYSIMSCYFIAGKYQDAIDTFETTPLYDAPADFPALDDLMQMVYEGYKQTGQEEKACLIYNMIEKRIPEKAADIDLSEALLAADFPTIAEAAESKESVCRFLNEYCCEAKSVKKAQTLNALLPGAGYSYVGQKKAALTSFIINTLFIAAAYEFFDRGYWAAGAITSSLELGWYIGGINGAGLAAKEYNERLYESKAKPVMIQNRLFPVLRLEYAF